MGQLRKRKRQGRQNELSEESLRGRKGCGLEGKWAVARKKKLRNPLAGDSTLIRSAQEFGRI